MIRVQRLLSVAAAFLCCGMAAKSQQLNFELRSNDRVVFYGDSITEQHFYTGWVETYVATRYPALHVRFWNAGVGGDRTTGGSGGTIDERLQRDVFSRNPTVITIMLGMNDGSYTHLTPAIEAAYRKGYDHILQSIHEHAPQARVLCIGPSPYDDVTRPPTSYAGRYNETLIRFGQIDKDLAAQHGAAFTDANAPFNAALERGFAEDKLAATMLVPDRVHPDSPAHLLIAAAILRAWHAPDLVSATVLDAKTASSQGSRSVRVSGVSGGVSEAGGFRWTSLEEALPMALGRGNAALEYLRRISGFEDEFDHETVQVTGLVPGRYHLQVDRSDTGIFSAEELAAGVNLVECNTPMLDQSQPVQWTVRDKSDLQFVRLRIAINKSSPEALPALDKAEQQMQQQIWQNATPVAHTFTLTRAGS